MIVPFLSSVPHAANRVPACIRSATAPSDGDISDPDDFGSRCRVAEFAEFVGATGFPVALDPLYNCGRVAAGDGVDLSAFGRFAVQMAMNQQLDMAPGRSTPDSGAGAATRNRLEHVPKMAKRIERHR